MQRNTGFLPDVYALATAVQALPGDSGAAADHASLLTLQAQMARLLGETPPATVQARK